MSISMPRTRKLRKFLMRESNEGPLWMAHTQLLSIRLVQSRGSIIYMFMQGETNCLPLIKMEQPTTEVMG